jgi:hypothetical protein
MTNGKLPLTNGSGNGYRARGQPDGVAEMSDGMQRPGPLRWLAYAYGARLPVRYREWVLHDVTTRTWAVRHFVRATLQLLPFAVLLYLFMPGGPVVRAAAVVGGLLLGYFYSTAYMFETAEHRAMKAGYPRGTAAEIRGRATAGDRAEAERRYRERYRGGPDV